MVIKLFERNEDMAEKKIRPVKAGNSKLLNLALRPDQSPVPARAALSPVLSLEPARLRF
jgi:hypothetical protein